MKRMLVLMTMLGCFVTVASHVNAETNYRVAKRIEVPGDAGWDLLTVDEAAGRIFLSHSTMVQVVDEKTGRLVGTVDGLNRVHGIALVPDLNMGFATCGADTAVVAFDLRSFKVTKKVVVTGVNPDAILYDPATRRIFVFNGRSSNATAIDPATGGIVGTVSLPGKPELAVSDGEGTVFVNLEDASMVAVIDARALEVTASWPLTPGTEPTGLAIDTDTHRLFSACNNKRMVVLDCETGAVVATLPIGEHVDGAAFDRGLKRAYASCGDGSLTVIQEQDANTFTVLDSVPTQRGARTIAVDGRTHHVFLPTASFGETPAATPENPRPRPAIIAGSFVVLDVKVETPRPKKQS